jgi:hypothetical protein
MTIHHLKQSTSTYPLFKVFLASGYQKKIFCFIFFPSSKDCVGSQQQDQGAKGGDPE